jgi:hypothetical protein
MNRAEHLQWCKDRANAIVDAGDTKEAFSSMVSDMGKHDETSDHKALEMGMMMLMGGMLDAPVQMRDFINGFN